MRVLPFKLIQPKVVLPRVDTLAYPLAMKSAAELYELLEQHPKDELLFIDFETRGSQPHQPDTYVVGMGLSNSLGTCYIDLRISYRKCWADFCHFIYENNIKCSAHNVAFDGLWSLRDFNIWFNWKVCTYGMYRHLASEGFSGQKWSLKRAQVDVLGWEETNEAELDAWLVANNHSLPRGGPDKSKMYKAPPEILGYYCALDAESTYLLYTHILRPVVQRFKEYQRYHEEDFIDLVRSVSEGYLRGIAINYHGVEEFSKYLEGVIQSQREKFFAFESVRNAIRTYNEQIVEEHKSSEPSPAYKKPEKLGLEPKRYRRDGQESLAWRSWNEKRERILSTPPIETLHHKHWREKLEKLIDLTHRYDNLTPDELTEAKDFGLFNLNSAKHKSWLFYNENALGHTPTRFTDEDESNPSIDDASLRMLGEEGKTLIEYNETVKEKSYVDAALEYASPITDVQHTHTSPESCPSHAIHVGLKVPGTFTGRLAGANGFNLQQQPKTRGYLEHFRPRPGFIWIDYDLCLAPEAEVLTPNGWKTIPELCAGEEVYQIHPETQTGSFVVPSRIINRPYDGIMYSYKTKRGELRVTAGHTMLWWNGLEYVTSKAGEENLDDNLHLLLVQICVDNLTQFDSMRVCLRPKDRTSYEYQGQVVCVTVPSGFILVRMDGQTFATGNCAVEPCVLTELSRDKAMLALYGPDAKPNDIYLFSMAQIPGVKDDILKTGYDPYNPTPELLAKAKKEAKTLRQIGKVVVLSSQYGAGPKKIQETLMLNGVNKTLEEVRFIHQAYWELFAGIKAYEQFLLQQWRKNGGWILNGVGRPLAIDDTYTKDIVNRICQSTGHDILMMYSRIVRTLLRKSRIEFYPVIADFHDQVIYEVHESRQEEALEIMSKTAFKLLNEELGYGRDSVVEIKGSGGIVKNLADAKCEA